MHPAELIVPVAGMTMMYADKILEGISADQFGRKPDGVDTNTPAWVFGHMSLYPEDMMTMLGIDGADENEAWKALFNHGTECKDDPSCTIYPSMDEIVDRYKSRHHVLFESMRAVDESVFEGENPIESMRGPFPTKAHFITFLVTSHEMMHLGQLSTWRRCVGLGPCM